MWSHLVCVEWAKSKLTKSNNVSKLKDQGSCKNSPILIMCELCTNNRSTTHGDSFDKLVLLREPLYPINHDQLRLRKRRERGEKNNKKKPPKHSVYIIASPTHYLQHAVPREHSWSKAYEGWDWSSLDHNKASIITYSYSFTEESRSEPPWNAICLLSSFSPHGHLLRLIDH